MVIALYILVFILIILSFSTGYLLGSMIEARKAVPEIEKPENTPYKKVRSRIPRVNFGDQLDPIVPEATKRLDIEVKEEVDYE